jgi:O-antigen ligase
MAIVITSFFAKLFSKNPDLIIFYLAGEAIRYLFLGDNSVEFSDEISLNNMGFFKFRVVPALNALILIITFYMRKNSYSNIYILIVFLLYSFFCLAFDARSNGVFFILTAVIYYKRSALVKVNYKKFLPYALAAATTFQVMYSTYVYQVLQGNIGGEHSKTQLLRSGNPYNPLNLLTSGRSEFFVALVAIGEKPFLGHGSWPRDIDGKFNYMVYELHNEENKYDEQMKLIDTELSIPSHSVVLGAWLSAGLLGLFSIVYIMILFVKSFLLIMKNTQYLNSPFIGIVIFFFLNGLWTFLFSPTAAIKSNLPVFIGYIVVLGCHKSFAFNVSKRNFRRINKYEKAIN